MSLATLREAVIETIRTAIPAVSCEAHGGRFDAAELRRVATSAPAVFVAALGWSDLAERQGEYQATVSWGVFVVGKDRPGLRRDLAAVALVDLLALIIPDNTWSSDDCLGAPQAVRADNLFSGSVDKMGVAMWALTWRQSMTLGRALTAGELASLDPFATLYARYPVDGDVSDADDAPEAVDRITLPQDGD